MEAIRPILVVAILFAAMPAWAQATADDVVVSYFYSGAGAFRGTVRGTCASFGGVLHSPGKLVLEAEDVRLVRTTTWVNLTTVAPDRPGVVVVTPLDKRIVVSSRGLPDGGYSLESPSSGLLALWPLGHPEGKEATVQLSFSGHDLDWTSASQGFRSESHYREDSDVSPTGVVKNGVRIEDGQYPAGARGFTIGDGAIRATGSSTMHLREVTIDGPQGRIVLPPYETVVQNTSDPANAFRTTTYRLEDAFLEAGYLAFDTAGNAATWACGTLDARLSGQLTVLRATGMATTTDDNHSFAGQVLTLSGEFSLQEEPGVIGGERAVRGAAQGAIEIVGIDFKVVSISGLLDGVAPKLGLAAVVLAGLALLVKKGSPALSVLFTRLTRKDIEAHPVRAGILAELRERGVMNVAGLTAQLGGSRSTMIHHLEILRHAGEISVDRFAGETLVALPGVAGKAKIITRLMTDERFRVIQEAFARGLSRAEATSLIVERFRISSRGARKWMQKYHGLAAGLRPNAMPLEVMR